MDKDYVSDKEIVGWNLDDGADGEYAVSLLKNGTWEIDGNRVSAVDIIAGALLGLYCSISAIEDTIEEK